MPCQKILLVEDDLVWGELLHSSLQRAGYHASWFVRARFSDASVILMYADGRECVLNAGDFEIAIVDGRLKGSPIDGWDLTPTLVAAGLPVIAASGDPWINERMIEAGAFRCLAKHDMIGPIVKGTFVFERPLPADLKPSGRTSGE